MSNPFIGLTMLVTLTDPPGAQVRGVVSSVVPGKSLTLRDVTAPSSGRYLPEYTIPAIEIASLVEAVDENVRRGSKQQNGNHVAQKAMVHQEQPPPLHQVQAPRAVPLPPVSVPTPSFEDPAILSVGRKPTPAALRHNSSGQWSATTAMERVDSSRTAKGRNDTAPYELNVATTITEPLNNISLAEVAASPLQYDELEAEVEQDGTLLEQQAGGKRRTRKRKGKKQVDVVSQEPEVVPTRETTRSKGWRKTPLLEPNPSFQPFNSLKRNRRGKQRIDEAGWATEDASEVQEMGDFDFERSLAKFDKQSVFLKIQAEDSIAEEDRLVSHNRLPKAKPGTGGGKNYHYTENVLETPNGHVITPKGTPKVKQEVWQSEESERDDRGSLKDTGSGRQSRRAESKLATTRRPSSRKGSAVIGAQPARSQSIAAQASNKPSFYLIPNDQRCETISTLQMLNLENIADNELGLTEDMMTENSGRGIAEIAFSALKSNGNARVALSAQKPVPTVIVFAGNNKSGLRAVAAGRHIRNHGINVVICVLGIERENELLVGLKRQIKVFRSFGGKVVSKIELIEHIKILESPVELIIDGLLGLTISFEELRTGDQATAYELIEWANRSAATVVAIDVPTGIDPTSGKVNIIDGRALYLKADIVVAVAAPKKGLLEAMIMGEGVGNEEGGKAWRLHVVDAGLGKAVWKKAGTRVRRGVEFEGSWVLGMRFVGVDS